jgi:uncharacterized protein (DUF1800 family)
MSSRLALATLSLALLLPTEERAAGAVGTPSAATAAHVLNRLAYGPRPGDVAHVQRVGAATWIEQQLRPAHIGTRALDARLARFGTLTLDTQTLFSRYYEPAILARRQARHARGQVTNIECSTGTDPGQEAACQQRLDIRDLTPDRLAPDRLVLAELSEARLLRAVYSERQLEEVLVDFWFNHFNVFAGKGPVRAYVTAFERDAIRPHVLGSFRQMLEAVAQSPAMLFYLDNWQNATPSAQATRAMNRARNGAVRMPRGINENYARELLELHTLGVDAGYTQADIVDVARAFTGWTMRPRQGTGFQFVAALHDGGEKRVLGHTLQAGGGIEDGQRVLDVLVAHPSTARFIATKLAQRFVSDTPPASLVDRAARRFAETGGNLLEVTRVIVSSHEFLDPATYRAKVKTPLEFVVSAVRGTGAEVQTALPLVRTLRDLGQPLYFCQPPTGYDEAGDTWVSSGALVARMNVALELGSGRLRGIRLTTSSSAVDARATALIQDALAGDVSEATRATTARATSPAQAVALVLGSPEFQRQ